MRALPFLAAALALAGCAAPPMTTGAAAPAYPPATDRLLTPDSADPAKLHYAPGYDTFPPFMTERAAYPTEIQANYAFQRSTWPQLKLPTHKRDIVILGGAPDTFDTSKSIRLFACRPGALDGVTGRVTRYSGPVIVCASDLLDGAGVPLARAPLNFYYANRAWHLVDPAPSYTPPPWRNFEPSPPALHWWDRDRY